MKRYKLENIDLMFLNCPQFPNLRHSDKISELTTDCGFGHIY